MKVKIEDITVNPGRRAVSQDGIEELYTETKAGVAQAIGRNKAKGKTTDCNLQSKKKPFIEDTADLTGQYPGTISRGNVWYLVKMLDTVGRSIKALGNLVTGCLLESK